MLDREALATAIPLRHSVRSYADEPIGSEAIATLREELDAANQASGLNMQLMLDEPNAFNYFVARYGKFRNVNNYIACVGDKGPNLHETVGYWGERLVLVTQALGLNTCWVALSFRRGKCPAIVAPGQKIACTIALGHGETQGKSHRIKTPQEVSRAKEPVPDWFKAGVEGALLAPTAVNQQRFMLALEGDRVHAEATGGAYCNIDLGIVKQNFEVASGKSHDIWLP